VINDLSTLLETPKEQVEQQVHESKCDDYSAMFNMLLDTKRVEKGKSDNFVRNIILNPFRSQLINFIKHNYCKE